jgi:hypothetical protein
MPAFNSLADMVKYYETRGEANPYTAVNPQSGAAGAYQFVPSTWRQYAGQMGVNTGQYPTANVAPPQVQDAVFSQAVAQRGLGDWTCPGCNAPLSQYVASNPGATQLPVQGTQGSLGSMVAQGDQPMAAPTPPPQPVTQPSQQPVSGTQLNPELLAIAMGRNSNSLGNLLAQATQPIQQYGQSIFSA